MARDIAASAEAACLRCGAAIERGARCCDECATLQSVKGPVGDPRVAWSGVLEEDGLDLTASARELLTLYEAADAHGGLLDPQSPFLEAAVRRYEHFWLPLVSSADARAALPLVPPLDVAWVWLLHRLAPWAYMEDCTSLCGALVDHDPVQAASCRVEAEARARELWTKRWPTESFDAPMTEEQAADVAASAGKSETGIKYDILRSAPAQAQFIYQTSRPQFRDTAFIRRGVSRYLRFLSVSPRRTRRMIVPTYDVDLIWHAHLSHPRLYREHCQALVGFVMFHDDSFGQGKTVRQSGSPLDECFRATARVYNDLYGEAYRRLELEYRGHDRPPDWRYAGSIEERLTALRPTAIMIGGRRAPEPGLRPEALDASDASNEWLHRVWLEENRKREVVRPSWSNRILQKTACMCRRRQVASHVGVRSS